MSVLIKGINLPTCCYYCPINDYSEDYDEWYCSLVNGNVTEFDTSRHPNCPLVDVPEESEE